MGLGNFIKLFQPKDKVFYNLFDDIVNNLLTMSEKFKNGVIARGKMDTAFLDEMKQHEHINDELTHSIYTELSKNFITPFDREDIHSLASGLDDIADNIYDSTKHLILYETPYQDSYVDFAELIYKACVEIQSAMLNLKGFKNAKEVKTACIKVNSLENEADDLLSEAMVELFKSEDSVKIIKISSVLEYLETVMNKTESVANIIQSIMIKYA